jgi:hypothetical protein
MIRIENMSIIENALEQCPLDYRERRRHFEKIVKDACGNCDHVSRAVTSRLLASIHSSKETSCVPGELNCKKIKEDGYSQYKILPQLLSYLLESYSVDIKHHKKPRNKLIENTIVSLENTIKLMNFERKFHIEGNIDKAILYITQRLIAMKPKEQITYHTGYPGHSFYAVWLKKRDGSIHCFINNLGQGCDWHYKDENNFVYPYVLGIKKEDILNHVDILVRSNFDSKNDYQEIIQNIYSSGSKLDYFNLPEKIQTTGNCVIKNWLCAARCSLKLNGDNGDSYDNLYSSLLGALTTQSCMGDRGTQGIDILSITNAAIQSQHSLSRKRPHDVMSGVRLFIDPSLLTSNNSVSTTGMATGDIMSKTDLQNLAGGGSGLAAAIITRVALHRVDMPELVKWGLALFAGIGAGAAISYGAGRAYGKGLPSHPRSVEAAEVVQHSVSNFNLGR